LRAIARKRAPTGVLGDGAVYNGTMETTDSRLCPICQGTGTVTYIDEEVGCQVQLPCWACAPKAETSLGQPAPGAPWL